MNRTNLTPNDKRFIVNTLWVVALLLMFGAWLAWISSSEPSYDAEQQAQQACIKNGGVPILGGSGNTMTKCEFKEGR